jgi:hypothetical protein
MMTRLVFSGLEPPTYPEDVREIVLAFKYQGYELSEADAERAWLAHSESYCAGWLCLPKYGREIVTTLLPYLKEES